MADFYCWPLGVGVLMYGLSLATEQDWRLASMITALCGHRFPFAVSAGRDRLQRAAVWAQLAAGGRQIGGVIGVVAMAIIASAVTGHGRGACTSGVLLHGYHVALPSVRGGLPRRHAGGHRLGAQARRRPPTRSDPSLAGSVPCSARLT